MSKSKRKDGNKSKDKQQTTDTPNEGGLYDKVLKENAVKIYRPLLEEKLPFKIKSEVPLTMKLQKTLEQELDFLYEIEDMLGKKYILHIEFQSYKDRKMLYRMQSYHSFVMERYGKKPLQFVIYLGKSRRQIKTQLTPEEVYTGFTEIAVHDRNVQDLLTSNDSEMVILAIAGNYPKSATETVIRAIIQRLQVLNQNPDDLAKYLKQLTIFARSQKLSKLTLKNINEMVIHYDITEDAFYQEGLAKNEAALIAAEERAAAAEAAAANAEAVAANAAAEKAEKLLVAITNLLKTSSFTHQQIANIFEVEVAVVEKIAADLTKQEGEGKKKKDK